MVNGRLLSNVTIVTMGPRREIIHEGALAWSGDTIVAVGKSAELRQRYAQFEQFDGQRHLVTPGFVDAHNHGAHFLSKGLFDDMAIEKRWKTRLYPFESAITEEETYWGSAATYAEQLLHGTTCVGDAGSGFPFAVARAAERTGIRAVVTGIITDTYDALRPLARGVESTARGMAQYNDRVFQELNRSASGRVTVAFGLWGGSTVSDELCCLIRDLAERRGAIVHGHLAARESDNIESLKKYGCRATVRYSRLGVLASNFVGAHAGAIDAYDVDLLAHSGANLTHCPSASMLGGFGCIAHGRFPELVAAGVNVALGSDAAAISRFLDMPRLMYLAACAHKDVRQDPEVMGAHRAMEMATLGGARALGLQDSIGSLERGKQADFVLVRTDGIEWQPRPLLNPVANLVYSSGGYRVDTVAVAGRIVVRNGELQSGDTSELLERTREASRSVASRAGLQETSVWPIT